MRYTEIDDKLGRRIIAEQAGTPIRVKRARCGGSTPTGGAPACVLSDVKPKRSTPMMNLSDVIELKRATDTSLYFRCPSQAQRIVTYDVRIDSREAGAHVACGCRDFQCRCKTHQPTLRDVAHHCKHIAAAIEYLSDSPTIEEMDAATGLCDDDLCADCGAILEEVPVAIAPYDYKREWRCVACDAAREAVAHE